MGAVKMYRVVSRCCKEVVYIDFLIILLTCISTPLVFNSSFLQLHPYFFVHFKNVFCSCYFCAI